MRPATLIVVAKAPLPGRVKTRLCPPLTPAEAADLAAAALHDTLEAATASTAARVVVAFDGEPDPWLTGFGVDVIPQRGRGLDERIAAAFADVGAPALLIGMDTPQVDATLLSRALATLAVHDAVLGPAEDGGFWALGLNARRDDLIVGVPMSRDDTGALQLARLVGAGLDVGRLETLRDVDLIADAHAVAATAPETRFASSLAAHAGASGVTR